MTAGRPSSSAVRGGARLPVALLALAWAGLAAFAANFPALTGRIVDQANVISAETRNAVEPKLADLEAKSGIQLVVATVTSLEGLEIEPYANLLFRPGSSARRRRTTACCCSSRRTSTGCASRSAMVLRAR
jgi:uncharacterized protein